jgi:hypothetical protein
MAFHCYDECHYAECCYAECRVLFIIMLNAVMLSVVNAECRHAECRYAECCYAECHYGECRGTSHAWNFRMNSLCWHDNKLVHLVQEDTLIRVYTLYAMQRCHPVRADEVMLSDGDEHSSLLQTVQPLLYRPRVVFVIIVSPESKYLIT